MAIRREMIETAVYPGKYVGRFIESGIKNKTTEAYNIWERSSEEEMERRDVCLRQFREALEKAERDLVTAERNFGTAVESLPPYPSLTLHNLWEEYVFISHEEGNPVWGID